MRCLRIAAVAAIAVAGMVVAAVGSVAQPRPPELAANSRVDHRLHRSARCRSRRRRSDRLRKRQVLEELAMFLSPLRLPRVLRVRTKSCGAVNAFYVPLGMGDQSLLRVLRESGSDRAAERTSPQGYHPRRGDRRRLHRRDLPRTGPCAVRHPERPGVRARGGCRRPDCRPSSCCSSARTWRARPSRAPPFTYLNVEESAHAHRVRRRARRSRAAVLQLPLPRLWRRAGGVQGLCRPGHAAEGARRATVRASISRSAAPSRRPSCRTSIWS